MEVQELTLTHSQSRPSDETGVPLLRRTYDSAPSDPAKFQAVPKLLGQGATNELAPGVRIEFDQGQMAAITFDSASLYKSTDGGATNRLTSGKSFAGSDHDGLSAMMFAPTKQ